MNMNSMKMKNSHESRKIYELYIQIIDDLRKIKSDKLNEMYYNLQLKLHDEQKYSDEEVITLLSDFKEEIEKEKINK